MADLLGLRELDYKIIRAIDKHGVDLAAVAQELHLSEGDLSKRLAHIREFFQQPQKSSEAKSDGQIIVRKLCSMAKLSSMQCAALILLYDGRTHQQIAEHFDISRPAVTRRILRAVQRLKNAGAKVPKFPRAYSAPRERWTDFR